MFWSWLHLFEKKRVPSLLNLLYGKNSYLTEVKQQLFTNGSQQGSKHSSLGGGYFSLLCNLFLNILSSVVDYKVRMQE